MEGVLNRRKIICLIMIYLSIYCRTLQGLRIMTFKEKLNHLPKGWLERLINNFFLSLINPDYPVEIFKNYLWSENERILTLPKHLRFAKYDEQGKKQTELEFDIPEMLGHEPFLGLIEMEYLDEIKEKVKQGIFNIPEYIIRKKESKFIEGFKNKYPSCDKYNEDVPDLFFKMLFRKKITCKYVSEQNIFIWNFTKILAHRTHNNIYIAYYHINHKVNNLRAFGIWRNIAKSDFNSLDHEFFNYIKEKIPLYKKYLNRKDYLGNEYKKFLWLHLEGENYSDNAYFPADPQNLIKCIAGNKEAERINKIMVDAIRKDETFKDKNTINTQIRKALNNIELKYEHLSPKSKAVLESAQPPKGKGKSNEKEWAIKVILNDADSQDVFNLPEIKSLFKRKSEEDQMLMTIISSNIMNPISSDASLVNSDGKKKSFYDKYNQSVFNNNNDISMDDEVFLTMVEEDIIKKQFPNESDENFVKDFTNNLKFLLNHLFNTTPENQKMFFEYKWSDQDLKYWYKNYLNLDNSKDIQKSDPLRKIFNRKMRNILLHIKGKIRQLESQE